MLLARYAQFLKNPGKYKSVSAFAPIANPSKCPWGEKAFSGYLGEEKSKWAEYDATELIRLWKGGHFEALIDVVSSHAYFVTPISVIAIRFADDMPISRVPATTSTSKVNFYRKTS